MSCARAVSVRSPISTATDLSGSRQGLAENAERNMPFGAAVSRRASIGRWPCSWPTRGGRPQLDRRASLTRSPSARRSRTIVARVCGAAERAGVPRTLRRSLRSRARRQWPVQAPQSNTVHTLAKRQQGRVLAPLTRDLVRIRFIPLDRFAPRCTTKLVTAVAEQGRRVRYITTAALVNELVEAADDK